MTGLLPFLMKVYGVLLLPVLLIWLLAGEPTPFVGGALGGAAGLSFFWALERWAS